jgi:hydrogenase maturation protein HypF
MNMVLLKNIVHNLNKNGLTPILHSRIPCNDGGLSLGQAVVAAATIE